MVYLLSCWCLVTESCRLPSVSLSYSLLLVKELIVSSGFPMFSEIPCSNRDPMCQSNTICTTCMCAQSCPTLCNPTDCSSVYGISQARIQEWVAISSSRRFSHPKDQTCVSCIAGRFFATEPFGKTQYIAQVRSKLLWVRRVLSTSHLAIHPASSLGGSEECPLNPSEHRAETTAPDSTGTPSSGWPVLGFLL